MSENIEEKEKINNWIKRDLFNAYSNLLEKPEKILLAIIASMPVEYNASFIFERFEAIVSLMEERAAKLAKEVV